MKRRILCFLFAKQTKRYFNGFTTADSFLISPYFPLINNIHARSAFAYVSSDFSKGRIKQTVLTFFYKLKLVQMSLAHCVSHDFAIIQRANMFDRIQQYAYLDVFEFHCLLSRVFYGPAGLSVVVGVQWDPGSVCFHLLSIYTLLPGLSSDSDGLSARELRDIGNKQIKWKNH